jgi:hypothetical protein
MSNDLFGLYLDENGGVVGRPCTRVSGPRDPGDGNPSAYWVVVQVSPDDDPHLQPEEQKQNQPGWVIGDYFVQRFARTVHREGPFSQGPALGAIWSVA